MINHINWELVSAFDNDRLAKEVKSHAATSQPLTNVDLDFDSLSKRFEVMTDKAKVYKPNYPFFQGEGCSVRATKAYTSPQLLNLGPPLLKR